MVSPTEVIRMFALLTANNIRFWLLGGWGIDALLGEQTREHKDIDGLILAKDVSRVLDLVDQAGYIDFHLWEENQWGFDHNGNKIPMAFYLFDAENREFDVHVVLLDNKGNAIPLWKVPDQNFMFTREDISAIGSINGVSIPCITPQKQILVHQGYDLPETHLTDLKHLHKKFGVDFTSDTNS